MQRFISSLGAMLLAAASVLALTPPAQAAQGLANVETTRYGGTDRYATSLRIAEAVAAEAGGSLDEVVLVSGRNWTDAVVAAPLAGHLGAAVLATPPGELRADAADFLKRVGVSTARIIGANSDTKGVGPTVVSALRRLGITTIRSSHSDQYTTAAHVANVIGTPGDMGDLGSTAVVASGEVFADALVAGAFATRGRHPVLLTPADELHDSATAYLRDLRVEHVVLMGGTAALSAEVEASIRALGIRVRRLAGATRYDTAVKAAELTARRYGSDCFTQRRVGVARARVPFDSFSAGPLLGRLCAPLLLADPGAIPADTAAYLDSIRRSTAGAGRKAVDLHVFGGEAAVSKAAVDQYLARTPAAAPSGTRVSCGVALGDKPSRLLNGRFAAHPRWSRDCSRVAYIGLNSDGIARLFTSNADGSDRTQVTDDEVSSFAWSPDGRRFVLSREAGFLVKGVPAAHLFVIDSDGSGEKRITDGNFMDTAPDWSPDGSRIVFSRRNLDSPDTGYDTQDVFVALIDPDGQKMTPLTRGGERDDNPTWSLDGTRIAYNSDGNIWIMRSDGTQRRMVTDDTHHAQGRATWSPDGNHLAFVRLEFLENRRGRSRLVTLSLDGTRIRTAASYSGPSGNRLVIRHPHWSPDGRSILFERAWSNGGSAKAYAAAAPA